MKNTYCIIKVYAATNNEYVVKDNLTFDEAQAEFERFNNLHDSSGEPHMYIIGDNYGDNDYDDNLLDEDDDEIEFGDLPYFGYPADDDY